MNRNSGANQTTYTYGGADELTSVTPPGQSAIPYSYDANGSLTGRGSDSFGWDAANRLSSLSVGGTTTSMSYSGDGLRATRTSGGVTTSYVWDVESGELLDDGTYQYVYGLGAGPLERVAIASQATVYYLPDGLGSTAAMVDQSGNTVQSYTYDVYGQATPSSQSFGNELQFAGQQTDPSGLQYLRARYYDPGTGRFFSRDTVPGNPYAYVDDDPTNAIDPRGRAALFLYESNLNPLGNPTIDHLILGVLPTDIYGNSTGAMTYWQAVPQNSPGPADLPLALFHLYDFGSLVAQPPSSQINGATQIYSWDNPNFWGIDAAEINGLVGNIADWVNSQNIAYNWSGPNSNSYAYAVLQALFQQDPHTLDPVIKQIGTPNVEQGFDPFPQLDCQRQLEMDIATISRDHASLPVCSPPDAVPLRMRPLCWVGVASPVAPMRDGHRP